MTGFHEHRKIRTDGHGPEYIRPLGRVSSQGPIEFDGSKGKSQSPSHGIAEVKKHAKILLHAETKPTKPTKKVVRLQI